MPLASRKKNQTRPLGQSKLNVSEIGFGCWGIGGPTPEIPSYGTPDDAVSRHALDKAFELGINFFDTADLYGNGKSEQILGEVFSSVRSQVFLATKGGILPDGKNQDFSVAHLQAMLDASLKNLKTDFVDVYQLHNPPPDFFKTDESLWPYLRSLKKKGVIRALGISAKSPEDAHAFIDLPELSSLQLNFNLIDQRVRDSGLLQKAQDKQIGIIARTPLCFGFLTGTVTAQKVYDKEDHRSRWSEAQKELWAQAPELFLSALPDLRERGPVSLALRFCLSHPAISTVIPGMMTPQEVEDNLRHAQGDCLSPDQLARLYEIYNQNEFFVKK